MSTNPFADETSSTNPFADETCATNPFAIDTDKSSNPFSDDVKSSNPFAIDEEEKMSNPFNHDEEKPSNPFDDDSNKSTNPFSDNSMKGSDKGTSSEKVVHANSIKKLGSSASLLKQIIPQKYENRLQNLLKMGFIKQDSITSLIQNEYSFTIAHQMLSNKVIDSYKENVESPAWAAPFTTRVGSWLPNNNVVEYIFTVRPSGSDHSYTLSKRYSEIHQLYKYLYSHLVVAFPSGMRNLFPNNRITGYMSGSTDALCDQRQNALDAWFREVILNPILMTNINAHNLMCSFVDLKDKFIDSNNL